MKAVSRRDLLKGSTALALGTVFASPARAAAPPPTAITPGLVEAAKKGAAAQGYCLSRMPGRGLSNVWNVTKDGKTMVASIRTTRELAATKLPAPARDRCRPA